MLGYILGWVILMIRPSWVFLFAFTAAVMVLNLIGVLGMSTDPVVVVPAVLIAGAIFMIVGGPIVAIRLWIRSRGAKKDKDLDAELARIRPEAAAREQSGG
jgi:hypothetical protein